MLELQHTERNTANVLHDGIVVARLFDFQSYVLVKVFTDGFEGQSNTIDGALQMIKTRLERI